MNEKLKSRTFWFSVVWSSFVPLSILAQVLLGGAVEIPIGTLIGMSGSITLAYVGGEKLRDSQKEKYGGDRK
jgi:hypothetical protein